MASAARHRFGFYRRSGLSKAPSSLRSAGALQSARPVVTLGRFLNHALKLATAILLLPTIQTARCGEVTLQYNLAIQPGLQLIADQLSPQATQTNTLWALFRNVPEGTEFYEYTNGDFTTNIFAFGEWREADQTLGPGEGAFILNSSDSFFEVLFAGLALEGQLTNVIPAGLSLKSSLALKPGRLTTDLSLKLAPWDNLYQWHSNHFDVYTVLPGRAWYPSEPVISIGESFFVNSARGTNWVQTFSLGP